MSLDVEPEHRSHRSSDLLSKQFRQRNAFTNNNDHSDIKYQSAYYDDFYEYDRHRRYRRLKSDQYRGHPKHYWDWTTYQDEMRRDRFSRKCNAGPPLSRTVSDYLQDYTAYIEMLDPLERRNFVLKFREENPKAYALWYTNYKVKVKMQKYISKTKKDPKLSTSASAKTSHDIRSLSRIVRFEKENEIHQGTLLRYQKYHINAKINVAFGRLFVLDSSEAKINIFKITPELNDNDTAELFRFSTPFVSGKTHKNVVTDYLNKLVKETLNGSERLLYELIVMITKRNGNVRGTDISEILMDNVVQVPAEDLADSVFGENMNSKDNKNLSEGLIKQFRDLLLQGDKTKTLELAISNQVWGLAYTLALYMDSKDFSYVQFKYFQTIPHNDTLTTFFQLNNGKIPSCTTRCTDSSWGDWRKHLAMILSNQHDNMNVARSATIQLGDALNAKGDLFGAHFCYLSIQAPLEPIELSSKLTLLGTFSNNRFDTMATNRAVLLTSAFEFSMRLNISDFYIPSLLPYKYLLAIRLSEYGECELALHHLEAIATQVISFPGSVNLGLVANVIELSRDLRYTQISNCNLLPAGSLDWLEMLENIFTSSTNNHKPGVDDIVPPQPNNNSNSQSPRTKSAVVPDNLPTISDSSLDCASSYQISRTQVSQQVVQPSSLHVVQKLPPSAANPNCWQPLQANVVPLPTTESATPPQNDHTQNYDPTFVSMSGETIKPNSPYETTSEISVNIPGLMLKAESEKTIISTAPKIEYFDRQMAVLELKGGPGVDENKDVVKTATENDSSQKEKSSWFGELTTKFWNPLNNTDWAGEDVGNRMVQSV